MSSIPTNTSIASPEQVVRAFFMSWEQDGFVPAFERYMHVDAVWQNLGFPDCIGREAYMGLMAQYNAFSGMPYGKVEIRNLAVAGNVVLTERIDHLFNKTGDKSHSTAIMGSFVVEEGLIKRYSDYFDPRQFFEMIEKAGLKMPG